LPHLILVSPHFPPLNVPDHQRVRQSLPYWEALGWEVEVVVVDPQQTTAPRDPFLESLLPPQVPVHTVRGLGLGWSRIPGLGSLGYRAMRAVYRALVTLLEQHQDMHDVVVYFSTTVFPIHIPIPALKKRFPGLTIVMDYQDPWFNPYYADNPQIVPPGGRFKYRISSLLDGYFERRVLKHVDGITMVSKSYREMLCARFPWFTTVPWLEIPFGGAAADFERIRQLETHQDIFDPLDGNIHWVHVGRGGPDMELAVRALCRALKSMQATLPDLQRVRLHFIGTDYAEAGRARKTLEPIAIEEGLQGAFTEYPGRVPYAIALRCLVDAGAIVMPGSTDAAYSASKLYPCILARRPLLAIFHRNSLVHKVLANTNAGIAVAFESDSTPDQLAAVIKAQWLVPTSWNKVPETDWAQFEQYTDRSMTSRLSAFLTSVMQRS
jgi:hypothetical protein